MNYKDRNNYKRAAKLSNLNPFISRLESIDTMFTNVQKHRFFELYINCDSSHTQSIDDVITDFESFLLNLKTLLRVVSDERTVLKEMIEEESKEEKTLDDIEPTYIVDVEE